MAKKLRDLEMHGFVEKREYPLEPPTVYYEATPYSNTLDGVLRELGEWGEQHREKVIQSIRKQ